jgi:integrase
LSAQLADPSIREQLDNWVGSKKGSVSAATLLGYEQARDLLVAFLGHGASRSVRHLTKKDVIAFRDHLRSEGRSPSTVNKICKKYLTGPFESARKEGLIDFNPFIAADALKTKKVEKDTFSPEQVAKLIAATDSRDWKGAILVGYCTGMRLQNVANLQWDSIDAEHGLISFVERKGDNPITIGLHPDLADWIAENQARHDPRSFVSYLSTHKPNYGDVFYQAAGASRLASILARRAWRSRRVKVQLKGDADRS